METNLCRSCTAKEVKLPRCSTSTTFFLDRWCGRRKSSLLCLVVGTCNANPANKLPALFPLQAASSEGVRSATWRQPWVGHTPPSHWCLSVGTMTWATPPRPGQSRTIAKCGVMTISAFGWGVFMCDRYFVFGIYFFFASHFNILSFIGQFCGSVCVNTCGISKGPRVVWALTLS